MDMKLQLTGELTLHHDVHVNNDDIRLFATLLGQALTALNSKPLWAADLSAGIQRLEIKMGKIDDRIKTFVDEVTPKLEALKLAADANVTALSNVAADEAAIKAKLDEALANDPDISPESQALLQGISAQLGERVTASQAAADQAQVLADSVPDAPPTV